MRKIAAILLTIVTLCTFSGCDWINEDKTMENVSMLQNYYYVGESDGYVAEMKGGKRESPLVVDGVAGKLKDYVKIKVTPKNASAADSITYKIGINEEPYEGTLAKELVGNAYSVTIPANELCEDYNLTLTCGGKSETIVLTSVIPKNSISFAEARAIADEELKTQIAKMSEEGGYEVYIKFVEGAKGSGEYLWYVAYLSETEINAVLISPTENKVVAKRG